MKNWIFTIVIALLCAGHAYAMSVVFPSIFDGITVTPDMVRTIPGKDDAVLVALKITVPPNAPPTASPMDGYREDMWVSRQLRADKHLIGAPTTLTAEQSYKTLFCLINKDVLGFSCKSTAEIMGAPKAKPWLIPIAVLPEKVVGDFTAFLTKAPIVVPGERMANVTQRGTRMNVSVNKSNRSVQQEMGWQENQVSEQLRPYLATTMEWYEGPVPEHLKRGSPPVKNSAGGPANKKRTP